MENPSMKIDIIIIIQFTENPTKKREITLQMSAKMIQFFRPNQSPVYEKKNAKSSLKNIRKHNKCFNNKLTINRHDYFTKIFPVHT